MLLLKEFSFLILPQDCQCSLPGSQNNRASEVGRHVWEWFRPTPCSEQSPWEQVAQTCVQLALNISKDGDCTRSLGDLFQCLTTLTVKRTFLTDYPVFQCVPIASCPLTGHHWEESGSVFISPSFRYLCTLLRSPRACSSAGWTVPALSS